MRQFIVKDVESFFHMSKDDTYKVLNISITPDMSAFFKIAEGKKGGERKQVMISLSTEELLKLAEICKIIAEKQMSSKVDIALNEMH